MIIASIVTMIVQIANIAFMGNTGSEAIYLRSLYTPFAFLSIAIIEGFQISNQVNIARLKGAGDIEGIKHGLINIGMISLAISLGFSLLVYILSPFISSFYNVPVHLSLDFNRFLLAMFLTNALVLISMIFISSLRGYGHVYLATVLSLLYAMLNITFVYVFSFDLNQGIFSIVFANLIVSLLFIGITSIILAKKGILSFRRKYFRLLKSTFITLRNVGLPIALSYIIIFVSVFFFNKIVEPFGIAAVSGFGVAYNIQTFLIIPAIAIGSAIGIIMNSNIGSGEKYFPRVFEAYKKGIIITIAFYLGLSFITFVFKEGLVSMMLDEQEFINNAITYLQIVAPSYLFMGVVLMTITTLEQINKGLFAVVLNILYFFLIIAVGWYLTVAFDELRYFYWTIFFTNILGISSIIYTFIKMRKEFGGISVNTEEKQEYTLKLAPFEKKFLPDILKLYEESGFRFKTVYSNYLNEREIESILKGDIVIIIYNHIVIGLVEFEEVMDAARHYKLYYRLSKDIDRKENIMILNEIVDSFMKRTQVIKLAFHCYEDDDYQDIFLNAGFEKEGQLETMLELDNQKSSLVYYHKIMNEKVKN